MNTDTFDGPEWRTLAGVGVGYGIASTLIFVLFFLVPYAVVMAL